MNDCKVLAVVNQKGGVGKITTSINLSASLGVLDKKVLLVDLDSQGNSTTGVGISKSSHDKTVYDLLVDKASLDEVIVKTEFKNLSIIPASINLAGVDIELMERSRIDRSFNRSTQLKKYLDVAKETYDYIIIDYPPSLGMLTTNTLASDYVSFDFTEDIIDMKKKYIPISYLNIYDVSTEATSNQGNAIFAIDGNYNTRWHSAWNGTDTERFITIKLNKEVHLSQIEYVPAGGGNGRIIDGLIEESMDGVNWFTIAQVNDLKYTGNQNAYDFGLSNIKVIETDSTNEVLYVRIKATKASNGNWFTAVMFNFYQDLTKSKNPSAGISYSTTNPTNGDVIATLVDYDKDNIKILGDGLNTHTFTENGEYEFIIMDIFTNNKTSIIASVNWIDSIKTDDKKNDTNIPKNDEANSDKENNNTEIPKKDEEINNNFKDTTIVDDSKETKNQNYRNIVILVVTLASLSIIFLIFMKKRKNK